MHASPVLFWGTCVFDLSSRRCPFCGEKIRREAIKCRFCGEFSELEQKGVCVACQVMMAICLFVLLAGIGVFLWQSSGW